MTFYNRSYNKFTDFLQDERFIHWKLFPTEESNAYWDNFLKENPHLLPLFEKAEEHFLNIKLEEDKITQIEKRRLWQSIQQSSNRVLKTTSIFSRKRIGIVAACSAAIIILALTLFFANLNQIEHKPGIKDEIAGSLLMEKEIQLITGDNSMSLENNVQVQVESSGKMKVIQKDNVEKTVDPVQGKTNRLIIPYGRQTQLYLADGSKVWLNSGSVLEFSTEFSDKNREVNLVSGEMYIEVAPNKEKPFLVKTSDFDVIVLGTKFNLSTYDNLPKSVTLVDGSISLHSNNKQEVKLIPGEQATYIGNKEFDTRKVDTSQFISWTKGYLIFNKTPLQEVLQQVERHYNLTFDTEDNVFKGYSCSGKLLLSENIDDVMSTIARLSDTYYTRDNEKIYISIKKPIK